MDFYKLILILNILGICFNVALTYVVIVCLITRQPIEPITVLILAFGYAVMIKRNFVFIELWEKWFKK
jgi:type IV secretory pathway VirB3-like protein